MIYSVEIFIIPTNFEWLVSICFQGYRIYATTTSFHKMLLMHTYEPGISHSEIVFICLLIFGQFSKNNFMILSLYYLKMGWMISIFCNFLPYLNKLCCNSENNWWQTFFLLDITHSQASVGLNCIIWRLHHSPIQYVVMIRVELADKLD